MATKGSARSRARRDLVEIKDQIRRQRRERDERIEQAALAVRVNLRRRVTVEAAAGRGVETLFAEGLTGSQVAEWCGGLTIAEIRRLRPRSRVIAISGSPSGARVEKFIRNGGIDVFLYKPFGKDELIEGVTKALHAPAF